MNNAIVEDLVVKLTLTLAAKIAESAFAGQSELLTREVTTVDVSTDEEALDDLGRNVDSYIFNQDDSDSQQVDDVRATILSTVPRQVKFSVA